MTNKSMSGTCPESIGGHLCDVLLGFFVGALASLAAAVAMRIRITEVGIPWGEGDLLTNYALVHTMQLSGWYTPNSNLGYPGQQDFSSYPVFDLTQLVILKFISLVVTNPVAVVNLYYLLGFALVAAAGYYALRVVKVHYAIAVLLALTFSLLPWHFSRLGHLFLSNYMSVSLGTMVIWILSQNGAWWRKGVHVVNKRLLLILGSLIIVGTSGLYYFVFFLGAAILTVGVRAAVERNLRLLGQRVLLLSVAVLALGISWLVIRVPRTTEALGPVVVRFPEESVTYGGYLFTLIRPLDALGTYLLDSLGSQALLDFPVPGEGNAGFNLGTVVAVLLALYVVLMLSLAAAHVSPFKGQHAVWPGLLLVALGTFALGGAGTFVALVLSPNIRAWGRFSIYVGFVSLVILGLYVTHRRRRKRLTAIVMVLLAIPLAVDISSGKYRVPTDIQAALQREGQAYVSQAEAALDAACPVLQLPVVAFPEMPPVHNMPDYSHLWPYLYSYDLRWSYGAVKNTEASRWMASLPDDVEGIISSARRAGFCAVHLDQSGYDSEQVRNEIEAILGPPVVTSTSGRWILFNLA